MSGGRLKIDLLPAGAVVGAFQVMDAVNDGVIDAAHTVAVYWYGKHKAASFFGTGPVFGGSAATMLGWFYQGGGQELYRELTQDILGLNVFGFYGFPMPAQPFGWFKKPVTTVDDIKGLKYRTVGLAADLMQEMGMSVAQLPGGEIVPAMERGVIDAFEFNNPSSDMRFGAQDVAKNYMLSSYHQASESFEFMFNKDFFDDLDARPAGDPAVRRRSRDTANYGWRSTSTRPTCRSCRTTWASTFSDAEGNPGCPARGLGRADHRRSRMTTFMKKSWTASAHGSSGSVFYELTNAPDYTLPTTTTSRAS